MIARENLLRAVQEYEAILARSAQLDANLPDHRKEAIKIRRQISDVLAAISFAAKDVFQDPVSDTHFRNEFSKMRSAIAFHQASWPVVSVDYADPEYTVSESGVRASCSEFIQWVRNALG